MIQIGTQPQTYTRRSHECHVIYEFSPVQPCPDLWHELKAHIPVLLFIRACITEKSNKKGDHKNTCQHTYIQAIFIYILPKNIHTAVCQRLCSPCFLHTKVGCRDHVFPIFLTQSTNPFLEMILELLVHSTKFVGTFAAHLLSSIHFLEISSTTIPVQSPKRKQRYQLLNPWTSLRTCNIVGWHQDLRSKQSERGRISTCVLTLLVVAEIKLNISSSSANNVTP